MLDNNTYATLTYCGNVSQKIENNLSKLIINVALKLVNKILNILYNTEEITHKVDKTRVYKLECSEHLY